jgi:hypothetical protein
MPNRYTYNAILKQKFTNKQYIETTTYPKIMPSDNDIYIITTAADRLDLLANYYFKDSSLWWIIALANNLNDASLHINVGTQIRIPGNIQNIISDLKKLNK